MRYALLIARECIPNLLVFVVLAVSADRARADEPKATPAQHELFEQRVRPLLLAKCIECHGDANPEGGLRLTSREHVLKGGDNGPVINLKQPDASKLLKAVRHTAGRKMPPDGKLADPEIDVLVKWVEGGLAWPDSSQVRPTTKAFRITASDRQHWSFRPITNPPVPTVNDASWPRTPIDAFILAKLESQHRKPAANADRRTLVRRVYYDLIGLPPTWSRISCRRHATASVGADIGSMSHASPTRKTACSCSAMPVCGPMRTRIAIT
jgi:hypothetical protein